MSHLLDHTPCNRSILYLNTLMHLADAKAAKVCNLTLGLTILADNLGSFAIFQSSLINR